MIVIVVTLAPWVLIVLLLAFGHREEMKHQRKGPQ